MSSVLSALSEEHSSWEYLNHYEGLRDFHPMHAIPGATSSTCLLDSICWRARFQWFKAERIALSEGKRIWYIRINEERRIRK